MNAKFLAVVLILSALFVAANKCYACDPPNQDPVANLTVYPEYVLTDVNVTLDGSASYDPDGSIVKCEWDWTNNGSYDYTEYPGDLKAEHAYDSPGTHTVKLRVWDNDNDKDTDTCMVYVNVKISVPNDVNTIQGAIDVATDGISTIVVSEGTYYENIDFKGKGITLTSTDPNNPEVVAATIINDDPCDPNVNVVTFKTSEDANCVLRGFTITGGERGIYCDGASPTITNCVITGNNDSSNGGGMFCDNSASPTVENCVFSENDANCGGGIYDYNSSPTVISCIFRGNDANCGGGIYDYNSSPTVINCTFTGNTAADDGGGMYNYGASSSPIVTNCIFWDNYAVDDGDEIYNSTDPNADPNFSYCDIEGCGGSGGWDPNFGTDCNGNIDSSPLFTDANNPAGPDGVFGTVDDGLHLQTDSPCIDAGDQNTDSNDIGTTDLTGYKRFMDGDHDGENVIDMGAYELPTIWYVDDDVQDGNGFSWASAYDDLQDALEDANDGDQIWVAEGTYKPDANDPNNPSLAFKLVEGVAVYGGFDGNEISRFERDLINNVVILSGDINEPNDPNDNSYHIVIGADAAVLDGFTITGGNADGPDANSNGGGIYCDESNFTVRRCIIGENTAEGNGGGIYCEDSDLIVTNCVIVENEAGDDGGGMYNYNSSSTVTNCTFNKNDANKGGGIYNYGTSNSAVTNCIFWGNEANDFGDQMASKYGFVSVDYSCIHQDSEPNDMISYWKFDEDSGTTAYDSAGDNNGTLNGDPNWVTGIIDGALSFDGVNDYVDLGNNASLNVEDSNFTISAWVNVTTFIPGGDTIFYEAGSSNGAALYQSINFQVAYSSITEGNISLHFYGDDYYSSGIISSNNWYHVVVTYNEGTKEGIFYINGSQVDSHTYSTGPEFTGGTMVGAQLGARYLAGTRTPDFNGSIDEVRIYDRALSSEEVQQLYQNVLISIGEGSIDGDPCFADANNPTGLDSIFGTLDDGLRLMADSPCIDAADGDAAPLADILGLGRIDIFDVNNTGTGDPNYADMGAYESGYDSDGDGMPDGWEIRYGLDPSNPNDAGTDLDEDGLSNLTEYRFGTRPDDSDTDDDNMPDGWEFSNGLDPLDPSDANEDADDDGLTNLQEYNAGTNPNDTDSDDDGMPDGWEYQYGLDPADSNDADTDLDSDGYSNLVEFLHEGDPNDPNAALSNITFTVPTEVITIQQAIDWSIDDDVIEVLKGTYLESVDFGGQAITLTSTNPNDWWVVELTIIDAGDANIAVVTFDGGEDSNSILTGLTLIGGEYGISCSSSSSPTITRCIIEDNNSYGIYCTSGSPEIKNNMIGLNDGDGIYSSSSTPPTIKNNWIYDNGKGIEFSSAGSAATVRNNTIVNNTSKGIYVSSGTAPAISNCILWDNTDDLDNCSATYSCIKNGDAGQGNISSNPQFINDPNIDCRLLRTSPCINAGDPNGTYTNEKDIEGQVREAKTIDMGADEVCEVHNTTQDIWYSDIAGEGIQDAIDDANSNDVVVVYEWTFYETIDFNGVNIKLTSTDPNNWKVVNCTIINANDSDANVVTFGSGEDANSILRGFTLTGGKHGAHCNNSSSPVIRNCDITNNNSAAVKCISGSPLITNNKIGGNSGDGVNSSSATPPTIKNNLIYKNDNGVIFASATSAAMIRNNTVVDNSNQGISVTSGTQPNISNCILWGHDTNDLVGCSATYSCIEDANDANGTGNISSDPLFVSPDSNNYCLHSSSPCIDAGDPNQTYTGEFGLYNAPLDLDGDGIVTLGSIPSYVICVKKGSIPTGDPHNTWENAYGELREALDSYLTGITEIWVAAGTYYPVLIGNSRTGTFELKDNVKIYGGFAGYEENESERDWTNNPTILSGDIGGPGDSDNCYHVVTGADNATLDGFTITGGNADSDWEDWPDNCGGGIYCYYASPTISNCVITGNNSAFGGGGMSNLDHSSPIVTNCTFSGNSSSYWGGGMYNEEECYPWVTNCVFVGNYAGTKGGGMCNATASDPNVTNCTFIKNTTDGDGGGMCNYNMGCPTVANCIFWDNYADGSGNEIRNLLDSNPTVRYCIVKGGYPGEYNADYDPLFIDSDNPAGQDGIFGTFDDGLRLKPSSPCIDWGNDTDIESTGVDTDVIGNPRIVDGDRDYYVAVDRGAYELPRICYVDVNAGCTTGCDGSSWEKAYPQLRDALSALSSERDGNEIWVAEGIYKPDGGTDRDANFALIPGVPIRGGYAGYNETDPYDRGFATYETILSGDISGDNSYHVVTATDGAGLEGFTITGGNANGSLENKCGGGIYCSGGSPIISNCTITDNKTDRGSGYFGGGMYIKNNSSPIVSKCRFAGNEAQIGGGIYSRNSSPKLFDCVFSKNLAQKGGGMRILATGSGVIVKPEIINCAFSYNEVSANGGGINSLGESSGICELEITNCVFNDNKANFGGGMFNRGETGTCDPEITNCVFIGNKATAEGGGMYNKEGSPVIINSTFNRNSSDDGGGMYNYASSNPTVTNCIFWDDEASTSAPEIYPTSGINVTFCDVEGGYPDVDNTNINSDPKFRDTDDPAGPDGLFGTWDDGLGIMAYSPCVDKADSSVADFPAIDITGRGRIDVPIAPNEDSTCADIGAYESPIVWFVKKTASGYNPGILASWSNAFAELRDALDDSPPAGHEIWVAGHTNGYTYKPDGGTDRDANFTLISGVDVYGGFAGTEGIRDWTAYKTILSGDIDAGDQDSYHVVIGADNTRLDGFTIEDGHADGSSPDNSGGGIYCNGVSPTINSCVIKDNEADYVGGGMFNYGGSSPTVTNCFFINNKGGKGGGMCNDEGSNPTLMNCVFSGNYAGDGGGMYNYSYPILINCTFSKNQAEWGGGGMFGSSPTVTNCIFWGNTGQGSVQVQQIAGSSVVKYSCIQDDNPNDANIPFGGADNNNIDDDPCFVDANDPNGPDNIFGTWDDGLRLGSSPCVDAADGDVAPSTDILGRPRFDAENVENNGSGWPDYAEMGAYEYFYDDLTRVVVMCWIDEARDESDSYCPFGYTYYNEDLQDYRDEINLHEGVVVLSGCLVPGNPITMVLPDGCSPPDEISVEEFPRTNPSPILKDFINHFNRIREGGVVPDYLCLSVDNSTSMTTDTINPYDPDPALAYPYDKFITWLDDTYSISVNNGNLIRRDGAGDFTNEQWVEEMTLQIQSVLP